MLDELGKYLREFSAKDLVVVISGVLTLSGTIYVARTKGTETREQRELDANAQARLADHTYNIAQTQDLTVRFRALMDGYEVHIRDLTVENTTQRATIKELQDRCRQLENRNG